MSVGLSLGTGLSLCRGSAQSSRQHGALLGSWDVLRRGSSDGGCCSGLDQAGDLGGAEGGHAGHGDGHGCNGCEWVGSGGGLNGSALHSRCRCGGHRSCRVSGEGADNGTGRVDDGSANGGADRVGDHRLGGGCASDDRSTMGSSSGSGDGRARRVGDHATGDGAGRVGSDGTDRVSSRVGDNSLVASRARRLGGHNDDMRAGVADRGDGQRLVAGGNLASDSGGGATCAEGGLGQGGVGGWQTWGDRRAGRARFLDSEGDAWVNGDDSSDASGAAGHDCNAGTSGDGLVGELGHSSGEAGSTCGRSSEVGTTWARGARGGDSSRDRAGGIGEDKDTVVGDHLTTGDSADGTCSFGDGLVTVDSADGAHSVGDDLTAGDSGEGACGVGDNRVLAGSSDSSRDGSPRGGVLAGA